MPRTTTETIRVAVDAEDYQALGEIMRLDTGDRMQAAMRMYAAFGFVEAAPCHGYPDELKPNMVVMVLPLVGAGKR